MVMLVHLLVPMPWPYAVLTRWNGAEYGLHPRMMGVAIAGIVAIALTFAITKGIIALRDRNIKQRIPLESQESIV